MNLILFQRRNNSCHSCRIPRTWIDGRYRASLGAWTRAQSPQFKYTLTRAILLLPFLLHSPHPKFQNATSSTTSLLRQAYNQGIRKFVLTSSYLAMVGTDVREQDPDERREGEEQGGGGVWSVYVFSDRGVYKISGVVPLASSLSFLLPLVILPVPTRLDPRNVRLRVQRIR